MRKLQLDDREIISSIHLNRICAEVGVEYENMIRYLLDRGYLVRIFRGIFYVKSLGKGVERWYFGLYTALILNGVTHEYFPVEFVLNDEIFRAREVELAGHRFRFIKIKLSLFFGLKEKGELGYSDLEKTILDFIYLWRYRGLPEEKIILDVSELVNEASKETL